MWSVGLVTAPRAGIVVAGARGGALDGAYRPYGHRAAVGFGFPARS
jgi:hypothetical protein